MTTNVRAVWRLVVFACGFALRIPAGAADTTAPDAITDLVVAEGSSTGSVDLQWTTPGDDGGAEAVTKYIIKYKANGTITTEAEWLTASRIDAPPLNQSPPDPASAASVETKTLTGLEPGALYGFAIKSEDEAGNLSTLSNSVTAYATSPCTQGANDGEGSATLLPASIQAGELTTTTMTFTVGANGIQTGGIIAMRVPDFWYEPQDSNSSFFGYTQVLPGGGVTATLDMEISGQLIEITVTNGSLASGETVSVIYNAFTCESGTNGRFRVQSQLQSCGQLIDISGSPFSISTVDGPPDFISLSTFDPAVLVNDIAQMDILVRDRCGHDVPVTSDTDVTVRVLKRENGSFVDDTVANASLNLDMSGASTNLTATVLSGHSGASIYYRITSASLKPDNYIETSYQSFYGPFTQVNISNVIPLATGVQNPSVDTGTPGSATSVMFSPDGDQSRDTAFIRATLEADLDWRILISKDNFSTVTRTFFGRGTSINVGWDGFTDGTQFSFPEIAPADTYDVKILVQGDAISDQSLQITLEASSARGTVVKSDLTTVADAEIDVFGPSQRYTRSNGSGVFNVYGLKPGSYTMRIRKPGFAESETTFSLSASEEKNLGNVTLTKQSILRLTVTRPAQGQLKETWGHLTARSADWSRQSFSSIHFGEGKTTADAGDIWNQTPTQTIDLTFQPGVAFLVRFEIPGGWGISEQSVSALAVDEVRTQTINLLRRPEISGRIILPSPITDNPLWVSVEAKKTGSFQRFYGGAFFQVGESEGFYFVPGLSDGAYTLQVFAPGYLSQSANTTISNNTDAQNVDITLSEGGSISGTITMNGDSSELGFNGSLRVPINARPLFAGHGSFAEVEVATHATQATGNYSLKGLPDGIYKIYSSIEGFSLAPPGNITVSGGVGTANLVFEQFTGEIRGTVTLPAGNSDFNNVSLEVLSFGEGFGQPLTTSPNISGIYIFINQGSGFYTVRARYDTTGLIVERSVQVTNGQTSALNFDLTGQTYSISGTLTTEASSPFNTISNYVSLGTPTAYNTNQGQQNFPANRVVARRLEGRGDFGGGDPSFLDTSRIFYGTVDSNGDYTIPNLNEGVYKVGPNGQMDGDTTNGVELAEEKQIISINGASVSGVDFLIKDGAEISGTLRVLSGTSESGRTITVFLMDGNQNRIAENRVFLSGTSANFKLTHIPAGSYLLSASDEQFGGDGPADSTSSSARKYWASSKRIEVNKSNATGNISNQEITLTSVAKIQGQLRLKNGELVTAVNKDQILPDSFSVFAIANPFQPNGYSRANDPLINDDNQFEIPVAPGTHDIILRTDGFDVNGALSAGQKPLIPITLRGIKVDAGQTKNIGVIQLSEGVDISGTITDTFGNPLANIQVEAEEVGEQMGEQDLETFSDEAGRYTLSGFDPKKKYEMSFAPHPDPYDYRFRSGFQGPLYGEVTKIVNASTTKTLDAVLTLAPGSITGRVTTPDNGDLIIPFDEGEGDEEGDQPGAVIIGLEKGDIPTGDNPFGDLETISDKDGNFTLSALTPGIYSLVIVAKGYGSVRVSNISVGQTATDIGTRQLVAGSRLSGKVYDTKGDPVPADLLREIIAVEPGLAGFIVGNFTKDASNSIDSYEISGFKTNTTYTLLAFDQNDNVVSFGTVIVNEDNDNYDIYAQKNEPVVLPVVSRDDDGVLTIRIECTSPLVNEETDLDDDGTADSSQFDEIVSVVSGNPTLTADDEWISEDRETLTFTAVGSAAFTLQFNLTFNDEDQDTGDNITAVKTFNFYPGLATEFTERIPNASGGQAAQDTDSFEFPAGAFGDDTDTVIETTVRVAALLDDIPSSQNTQTSSVMAMAEKLGMQAYPNEMAAAINRAKALDVNPLSSFYDILLPANVSHFFPEGREAKMCLTYDDSVSDPSDLNIYYYNSETNEYLLENENRSVDTENQRVCASISHASVFTILASSASIISGSGYTGELAVMNFPNPFDLKPKTLTLQNPGTGVNATQVVNGTMIKFSVPSTIAGAVEIEIFNVLGEKVRTLNSTVSTGGSHFYMEWNGKNERGADVASGTYIARFTIGGGNEKFFKMAVLK